MFLIQSFESIVASLHDREAAYSASDIMNQISHPVSGVHHHRNHHPSLACMRIQVAQPLQR